MTDASPFDALSPPLRAALEARGFAALTPVQEAVLAPELRGRDLRIFSQTGSGKTVAVGLSIAPDLERVVASFAELGARGVPARRGAFPFALVIAPTRELATQIGRELGWLFEPLGAEVAVVTGGASVPRELVALRRAPLVVVGTPGRLLDHLGRGAIDPSEIGVVVLDEADQMLDLGFRDELDAILGQTPEARRTLLLSATFPREVARLADRCQKDPIVAGGGRAGEVNQDIAHVAHLVLPEERDRAVANLLLMAPGERALVFVRTREGAAELADKLSDIGLPARAIHGDLEQRDRTRTLDAFRSGAVTTLVATDVAARGIDVPDVGRVIQADPPGDSEVFTHRSGRTGRAGKKGTTVSLVPPAAREHLVRMLRRAGVEATWAPVPSVADVNAAADARLVADLAGAAGEAEAAAPRVRALADRLLASIGPRELVTALLARATHVVPCEPFEVTPMAPPAPAPGRTRAQAWAERPGAPRTTPPPRGAAERPRRGPDAEGSAPRHEGFVPFKVTWGARHGADPRRVLAMVCRRGDVRGQDVGAIRVGETHSTFEVSAAVAQTFAEAAARPDARDPRVRIERLASEPTPASRARPAWHARDDGPNARPQAGEGEGASPPWTRPYKPAPRYHTASEPPPRFVRGPNDRDVAPPPPARGPSAQGFERPRPGGPAGKPWAPRPDRVRAGGDVPPKRRTGRG
jgi:ATP-dependent RNA helicase DeaD